MDATDSLFRTFLLVTFLSTLTLLNVRRIEAQVTAVPVCESTGHRCITPDQCSSLSLPDGQYQWCGGCQNNVRCLGGVGNLFGYFNPPYTQWDDNKKNYELTSTTCSECYYPCPPGPSAPTNPSGPLCNQTGFGCLTTTCPGGAAGNFQYCVDCSNYVTCSISTGYSLNPCNTGTYYDDFFRTCVASSTTCRECYNTCVPPTTQPPSTEGPTTEPLTTENTEAPGEGERSNGPGEDDSTSRPSDQTTQGAASLTINIVCFYFLSILGVLRVLFSK